MTDALAAARTDPAQARQLLTLCTLGSRSDDVARARTVLITAGVPGEYLPTYQNGPITNGQL